ncbi:MAG: hypothetical protein JW827_07790 [Spirochaetes bacterium]|nr:hypothetical protein [Spirochaetota bacterium]
MFAENIKLIKEAEEKAKDLVDQAHSRGRDLVKEASVKSEKLQIELKQKIQEHRRDQNDLALRSAQKEIEKLKKKTDDEIKKIIEDSKSHRTRSEKIVYNFIISL